MANQSWWSTARSGAASFDVGQTMSTSASCSTPEHADESHSIAGGSHWANTGELFDAKSSSCDESPISMSNSSVTYQEIQNPHVSAPPMLLVDAVPQALDFGVSSPSTEWNTQTNFLQFTSSNTGLRAENSFQVLFQEDSSLSQLKDMNRSNLLHDNIHGWSSNAIHSVPLISASAPLQQRLSKPINNMKSNYSLNYNREVLYESLPQLAKGLATPVTSATEARSNLQHGRPWQQILQDENQGSCKNLVISKQASSGVGTNFSVVEKKTGSGPANKKPRLGASTSLPTIKIRKEKLGDRITALQQLVSPFGKTDTASVLHEAIEYIKFLHDQVRVSSAPYLKSGQQMPQSLDRPKNSQGQEQDLESRGLCLVPVSSTFAVANDIPTDFFTPTFLGSFR